MTNITIRENIGVFVVVVVVVVVAIQDIPLVPYSGMALSRPVRSRNISPAVEVKPTFNGLPETRFFVLLRLLSRYHGLLS